MTDGKKTADEPQELNKKELDDVQGGYTEVEWTYAKGEGPKKGSNSKKPIDDTVVVWCREFN